MSSGSGIYKIDNFRPCTRLSWSYRNELRSLQSPRSVTPKQSKHSAAIRALKKHVTQLEVERRELESKVDYLQYMLDTEVYRRRKLKVKTDSMCQEIESMKKVLSNHGISAALTRSALQQFNGGNLEGKDLIIPPYRPPQSPSAKVETNERALCKKRLAADNDQSPVTHHRKQIKLETCFIVQTTSSKFRRHGDDTPHKATEPDKLSKFNEWIESSIESCPMFSPQVVLHRLDPKIIKSFRQNIRKTKCPRHS